jgi:hypothetical protein
VQPRRLRTIVFTIARSGWFIGIFLLACPSLLSAESSSNVVCRDNLSSQRRNELAIKLRRITGWSDLKFDREGALRLGTREPTGGSKSARALLRNVVYGANVVVLEDASKRDDVVFCRVVPGRWKEHSAAKPPVYVVLIDFVDFEQVTGDQRALNAFDVGWGLLHELDHIESDSADSASIGEPGECEDHINQMRRECNLPQRADYFFTLFPLNPDDPFTTRLVRLAFEQEDAGTDKKKRYWLIWDAKLVGGLNEQKQIALLR